MKICTIETEKLFCQERTMNIDTKLKTNELLNCTEKLQEDTTGWMIDQRDIWTQT